MSDVYYIHWPNGDISGKYTDYAQMCADAREFVQEERKKLPFYTVNQNEAMHHFTAKELAEPTPQAEPREFKLGDVVRIKGIDSPKMVVNRESTIEYSTIGVFWFGNNADIIYKAFEPTLLTHAD